MASRKFTAIPSTLDFFPTALGFAVLRHAYCPFLYYERPGLIRLRLRFSNLNTKYTIRCLLRGKAYRNNISVLQLHLPNYDVFRIPRTVYSTVSHSQIRYFSQLETKLRTRRYTYREITSTTKRNNFATLTTPFFDTEDC
jgi:hypothetical protein